MAINPETTDAVIVGQLDTAALALNNYFAHEISTGKLRKATLNQLAVFLAPYISSVGASGYVPVSGTVLPNIPSIDSAFTLVPGPATYTQTTGGSVITTSPLSILSWNETTWSLTSEITIPIDTSGDQGTFTARQNVLTEDESKFNGTGAGRWGTIGTPPTFSVISGKLRISLTSGQNQWLQIAGIYKLNKTYDVSLKARLVSGVAGQVTFGIATGGVSANNIKFTPTSVEQTFTGTITTTSGATDLSLGTIAAQNTGQVYEFDDIVFYEKQEIDLKILNGDNLSVEKQVNRMESPIYKLDHTVYEGTSIRTSLQLYSIVTPVTSQVEFKTIKSRIWGTSTTKATVRLYESTGSETFISQMKFINEWKFGTGELNKIENEFTALTLDDTYIAYAGSKLVLFLYTESGDNIRTTQLLPTDPGYALGSFYYILSVVPANPWYKTGINPLTLTTAGSAKSEAIIIISERYSTESDLAKISPERLLLSQLSDLTLTGWYNNSPYIEAVGNGVFANNRAVYSANTVLAEADLYAKMRPVETGAGGIEFGVARRSYIAGTAVTIGNDGTDSFVKIYLLSNDSDSLVGTFILPFLVEVGATYQIRLGKIEAKLIIEIWKDTGEYYIKDDWAQTSPGNPNFGGMWGHPTLYAIKGKIQAHSFDFTTNLSTTAKLVAWGDSYIEASTLGVDRSGSYINLLKARLGDNMVSALGRGGEKTADVDNRFPWELNWFKYSKYAYLAIGINDSDYTIWLTNMKDLISQVRSKGMTPILATITANTNGSNFSLMTQQNDWIRNVSGEIYVDVHKAVSAGGSDWKPGTVMVDGVHPTLLGHQMIYQRMCYDLPFIL